MLVHAVDQPHVKPLELPSRFRTEIVYFMTPPGERGAPSDLGQDEYWVDPSDARRWLDEAVVYVVSPLDAENQAEIELTEYHEEFLEWLLAGNVQRVRIT
jgi:hypothetical protein